MDNNVNVTVVNENETETGKDKLRFETVEDFMKGFFNRDPDDPFIM